MSFTSSQSARTSDKQKVTSGTAAITGSDQSVAHTVGRSIPFEPYTLPTLKTETLESAEPLVSVKQEPASQTADESLFDVPESLNRKRNRGNNPEQPVLDEGNPCVWKSKRSRIDTAANVKEEQTNTRHEVSPVSTSITFHT